MEKEMLEILEKNARITNEDLGVMLGIGTEEVAKMREKFENEKVICGYNTLINWDNTEREYVTAMIEVKVTPQRDSGFDRIAKRIYNFDEVKAVYLMSGTFDLTIILEGKNIKEISHFVSSRLSTIEGILSTSTHFVLNKYKDHGIILEKPKSTDERMIVSP